ncbi:bifunctional glycosyltransferase/CDP-glycerol:glycerophosphate glycerophosphotransferase [Nocardioides massiliensis]|uniref:CDP-glycerol glycerophosphotransferase n=1 Tax=Nocardioides massiliensis TaxID=1325935 RepID=A0ABT9NKC7_9ACTN|nr:CDP-glycerol glycerophosphotransferase family protein [Nocardioides massiliensis]MDP9820867.1 CDP-glycerol glycerophosphotransferase [Nocardioides massiliensis]
MSQTTPGAARRRPGGRLIERTPPRVRRVAGRVRRAVLARGRAATAVADTPAQPRGKRPVLSVVIPVYNVAEYLPACLDSALGQTLRNLEIIAVDDGSTDESLEILRAYEARDPRVRVLTQVNAGQGIARNTGVDIARGEFLTFLDSDDTVPPAAYATMVKTLRQTGSDFVVGSARRFSNDRFHPTGWARTVHLADRLGTTIDEFPAAMQDIIACNRMFRAAFWREAIGGFRGHIAYEDHVPMLAAYVRAERFDILAKVTYNWRIREDRTSTGQQKHNLENLLDRIAVKEEAYEMLVAEASEVVYDAWVARAIEVDFPAFISHALAGAEMYRNVLSAAYRTFFSRASDAALAEVRFVQKLRGWLIGQSRWDDLAAADGFFRLNGTLPPTVVRDGRVLPSVPADATFLDEVPARIQELSTYETGFEGVVRRITWLPDGQLELTGWAMPRSIDLSDRMPDLQLWWEEVTTGERRPLEPRQSIDPAPTRWSPHLNAAYDGAYFTVRSTVGDLAPGTWALRVRVEVDGVVRTGAIHTRVRASSAAVPRARAFGPEETGSDVHLVTPGIDFTHGLGVVVEAVDLVVTALSVDGDTLRGTLSGAAAPRVTAVVATAGDHKITGTPQPDGTFALTLPVGEHARRWKVRALVDGARLPLRPAPGTDSDDGSWPGGGQWGAGTLAWTTSPAGALRLTTDTPRCEVLAAELTAEGFQVTIRHAGVDLASARLVAGPVTLRLLDHSELGPDTARLVLDRDHAVLGGPRLPAPVGRYVLCLDAVDGSAVHAHAGPRLAGTLPRRVRDDRLSLRYGVRPNGELVHEVRVPLRADEEGAAKQHRLRQHHRTADLEPRDAVLFQCYLGEFATDSQAALDRALAVRRPDLVRYWGVRDHATAVPEGSVPIVIGSREWHDILGSARYLCNNIDFPGFFTKRPHQCYLQTFHGYPFKSMGRSFWAGKGWGPERIAQELARRNAEYDAIVVPSERAADFYRNEYDYAGRVLATGYPRSDFIVNADRDRVRSDVLARLGVDPATTVVLYAPTYRDHLTTRTYAAKLFDELDLTALTAQLGPRVTILLRGHNNNQRELDRVLSIPQVVDVTDYPEINELTVAADVAVLDYSSLRFDWALTGRPAVYFVPDVESYFAQRPPLFPYAGTAPGPWATSTDEVAAALADVPGLQAQYGAEIATFNAEFNKLHDGHATERVIDAFFTD